LNWPDALCPRGQDLAGISAYGASHALHGSTYAGVPLQHHPCQQPHPFGVSGHFAQQQQQPTPFAPPLAHGAPLIGRVSSTASDPLPGRAAQWHGQVGPMPGAWTAPALAHGRLSDATSSGELPPVQVAASSAAATWSSVDPCIHAGQQQHVGDARWAWVAAEAGGGARARVGPPPAAAGSGGPPDDERAQLPRRPSDWALLRALEDDIRGGGNGGLLEALGGLDAAGLVDQARLVGGMRTLFMDPFHGHHIASNFPILKGK
jgi:hypothetical protein